MKKYVLEAIRSYQRVTRTFGKVIAPMFRPFGIEVGSSFGCRFTPTCSEFTYEAIGRYGIIVGSWYGARRLIRCNPFSKGGFDPLPDIMKREGRK